MGAPGLCAIARDEREPASRRAARPSSRTSTNATSTRRPGGSAAERLPRLVERAHGADDLGEARRLEQLDQVVPGRPLVLDDERTKSGGHRLSPPAPRRGARRSTASPAPTTRCGTTPPVPRARAAACTAWSPKAPARTSESGMPGPLSSTMQTSIPSAPREALTLTTPPPSSRRLSAPCFTAFSTSGWRRRRGSIAPSHSAGTSHAKVSEPWCRASRISAYRRSHATCLSSGCVIGLRLHRVAQQVTQAHEQPPRLARLLGDEPRHGVERVEQEVRLEVSTQPRQLRPRAQLEGLEVADARALDRERVHDRERPQAEVHLRVEDPEERRAQHDEGVAGGGRHVEAHLGHVHGHEAVEQPEGAPERGRDRDPREQTLPGAHAAAERPPEGRRQGEHQQRQLARHEDGAREDARRLARGDDVGGDLEERHPQDHRDADGPPRAQDRDAGGCGT